MQTIHRTYVKELGAALIAYAVVLIGSIVLIERAAQNSIWRYPVALLPMIPAFFGVLAVVRLIDRSDELQRRIMLSALSFAFGGTFVVTFSYGLLQNVGLPALNWMWVWPVMAVLWIVGGVLAQRRYA